MALILTDAVAHATTLGPSAAGIPQLCIRNGPDTPLS